MVSKLLKKRVEPRKVKRKRVSTGIFRKTRVFADPYGWCSTLGGVNKEIKFVIENGKIVKTFADGEEL